jgi:predicted NBD/HSP70 family sugar kinase
MEIGTRDTSLPGVDAARTRAFNRSVILARIKDQGPISRAMIGRSTTLAKATVSVIVDELIASGLVVESGVGTTSRKGGRPPILLQYNGRSELLVGIHIGVQRTTVAVATGAGEELARRHAATVRTSPEATIDLCAALTREALAELTAEVGEVVAFAVCLPGLTDSVRGLCLLAPNLGWRDVPVMTLLAARLGTTVPIRVQNTTQAVALAENLEGAGVGVRDMLLVYVGTGIGAAFIHDGMLVSGARGIAGELGHCTVPESTRRCMCGKVGCLETVASAHGIRATVMARLAAGAARPPSLPGPITADRVAHCAMAGEPVCVDAVQQAGTELGRAISWAVNLLNPSTVIIAGGVAEMGELLLRPLRAAVQAGVLAEEFASVEIRQAELGQEAKVRGAIHTALLSWQGATARSLGR